MATCMKLVQSEKELFSCDKCDLTFRSRWLLKRHQTIHAEDQGTRIENRGNCKQTAEPLPLPAFQRSEPPKQVTAQVMQTQQGPKLVLKGIQGNNLSKEQ